MAPGTLKPAATEQIQEGALYCLLREPLKEGIRRAVAELDITGSMTMAERVTKLEAVDKRIDKVEQEITVLRSEAKAAGIRL